MSTRKKIQLVFPQSYFETVTNFKSKTSKNKIMNQFAANIDEIADWFNKYEIESIELWISGIIETEGILKLAISAKGEGGMKILLKPKRK